jgi:uncharacterized membrane protein
MRKLEQLSNTIFGVAMTLLAYDLPKAAQFDHVPDWNDLYHTFGGRLTGMVLSFVIAGIFWLSHHRRLTRQPMGSRFVVMLNLLFLLSIILLPVTNALYGNYRMSSAVAVLYGLHLTVIAGLNALLWRLALGPGYHPELLAASFPVLVFIPGTVVAGYEPPYATYFWGVAFFALLIRRLASRSDAT